jgi:hypothetical protein
MYKKCILGNEFNNFLSTLSTTNPKILLTQSILYLQKLIVFHELKGISSNFCKYKKIFGFVVERVDKKLLNSFPRIHFLYILLQL